MNKYCTRREWTTSLLRLTLALCLLAALLIAPISIAPPSVETPVLAAELDEPVHRKYIEAGTDGAYDLTLEVTGEKLVTNYPIDVVLIFDCSYSTTSTMIKAFKVATNLLAEVVLSEKNGELPAHLQNRIGIVTFGTTGKVELGLTSNQKAVEDAIDKIDVRPGGTGQGYTNWEYPLISAKNILNDPNNYGGGRELANTHRYTVFQTDDIPNRYGYTNVASYSENWRCVPPSYNAAADLLNTGVTLYSVYADRSEDVEYSYIRDDVDFDTLASQSIASGIFTNRATLGYSLVLDNLTRAAYVKAGRGIEFDNKFFTIPPGAVEADYSHTYSDIMEDITLTQSYRDVIITDALSDYVDLVNATDGEGNVLGASVKAIHVDGEEAVDTNDYTLKYDAENRQVVWQLNFALEHHVIYRLTFTIEPSQQAYDEYAHNLRQGNYSDQGGYPAVGGEDTGDISAGEAGFPSNTSETSLTYFIEDEGVIVGDDPIPAAPFEIPVVKAAVGSLTINKTWGDEPPESQPDSIEVTLKMDNADLATVALTKEAGWTTTVENLAVGPEGHTYSISETNPSAVYEVTYNPDPPQVQLIGREPTSATISLTNTRTGGEMILEKIDADDSRVLLSGASFKLYHSSETWEQGEEVTGYNVTEENGRYRFAGLAFGYYLLEETNAPDGYQLNTQLHQIHFQTNGQTFRLTNLKAFLLPNTGGGRPEIFYFAGATITLVAAALFILNSHADGGLDHNLPWRRK